MVLGGYSHESVNLDVTTLLRSIANGFHDVPVADALQEVGTYTTPWGESADMILARRRVAVHLVGHPDHGDDGDHDTDDRRQGRAGRQRHLDRRARTRSPSPSCSTGAIAPPDDWWRLTHPFELGG